VNGTASDIEGCNASRRTYQDGLIAFLAIVDDVPGKEAFAGATLATQKDVGTFLEGIEHFLLFLVQFFNFLLCHSQ
jgi:hypothetical protein